MLSTSNEQPEASDEGSEFVRYFDEELSPALHPIRGPFPFELAQPRLRDLIIGKQWVAAVVLIGGLIMVTVIELFTDIDLGLVPNDPAMTGDDTLAQVPVQSPLRRPPDPPAWWLKSGFKFPIRYDWLTWHDRGASS